MKILSTAYTLQYDYYSCKDPLERRSENQMPSVVISLNREKDSVPSIHRTGFGLRSVLD